MKKSRILFALLAVIGLGFASCGDDSTTTPAPVIQFPNNVNSATVEEGTTSYDIIATVTAEAKLDEIKYFKVAANGDELQLGIVTTFTSPTSHVLSFSVDLDAADVKVRVQATDKDNQTSSKIFTITFAGAQGGPIRSISSAILMGGAEHATLGSYLNARTGDVYLMLAANTTPANVDMAYQYGTTNLAFLGSPNDAAVQSVYSNISGWNVKNDTKFTALLTGVDFDAVVNDLVITNVVTTSTATATKITNLAAGNIFGYITASGKKGLIKVNSVNGTTPATRNISLYLKVQE